MAKPLSSGTTGRVWEKKLGPRDGPWADLCHAHTALALAAVDVPGQSPRLFCVTRDTKLWCRDLAARDGPWQTVGHGCPATTLAAVNLPGSGPKLFCTTRDYRMYARDAVPTPAPWDCVGHAKGVVALAALELPGAGPMLYCVTDDNLLHRRDAAGMDTPWLVVGDAACVGGLAALDVPGEGPHLFCATTDNRLYRRPAAATETAWQQVGHAKNVVALAATSDRLLCLTPGERVRLAPIPHQVFLPIRKQIVVTGEVRTEEARRITIVDELGNSVGGWVGKNDWDIDSTPYFAEQGSTPGVVVLEVLYERQYDEDPAWYGMRCTVSHRRGGKRTPEELTVAAEGCWVKFRWER